jgi:hypothetical protein
MILLERMHFISYSIIFLHVVSIDTDYIHQVFDVIGELSASKAGKLIRSGRDLDILTALNSIRSTISTTDNEYSKREYYSHNLQ